MLIRNLQAHPDDLHDGRPIPPFESADITAEDLQLEHYQARIRDGLFALQSDDTGRQTVEEIEALIATATPEDRERVKAEILERENASGKPRKGVLDATKPDNEEND